MGWNPISDPLASDILSKLRLDQSGQAWVSVAFLAKTAGVFNACASFFVKDPLALTYPILFFLGLGALFSAVRAAGRHPIAGVLAFLVLFRLAPSETYVDKTLALASGGLLFSMYSMLATSRFHFVQASVFTFWMANCKLTGCAAAIVFWGVFLAFSFARNRAPVRVEIIRKTVAVTVAVLGLSCVASFHPYGTSLRDYGHPLYPLQTIDESRFPRMNIPADCKLGNDDWHRMDYWGIWANTYVSPSLVRTWYNRKLGRHDFAPHQYIWDYSWEDTGKRSPISPRERAWILLSAAILILLPKWRPFGLMMILGLSLFPKQYMGYLRYYPWLSAFKALAVLSMSEWVFTRCRFSKVISFLCSLTISPFLVSMFFSGLSAFVAKEREIGITRPYVMAPYRITWAVPESVDMEGKPLYLEGRAHMNNAILLLRQLGKQQTEVRFVPPGKIEGLYVTRFGYYIDARYANTLVSGNRNPSKVELVRKTLKVLLVDYPHLMLNRFKGKSPSFNPPIQILSDVIQKLPEANGYSSGIGFTCTGLTWDSDKDVFWVGNIGKETPMTRGFASSLVCLSRNFETNLDEIALYSIYPSMKDIQGVTINPIDGSFWLASCEEGKIHHLSKKKHPLESFSFLRPTGIVYDIRDETLWILSNKELMHSTTNGSIIAKWPCSKSGQDQLFLDEKTGKLFFTAGDNYQKSSFVFEFDIETGAIINRFELADSYAIEGLWMDGDGHMFVLNDGYYHGAKIPQNQVNTYTLPTSQQLSRNE